MCDCIEEYKMNLDIVTDLAIKLSILIESDVRIYTKKLFPNNVYDFEPVFVNTNVATEISIINYDKK
jgi:hypothetical protein